MNKAKELKLPYLEYDAAQHDINYISDLLSNGGQQSIQQLASPEYAYKPSATFSMGYNEQHIFLKYFVCEESIRAVNFETNSNVYEDTCVEFFIAFDDDENYYNLEFNCFGTCLAGYGKGKKGRSFLPVDIVEKITYMPYIISIKTSGYNEIYWELTLIIPISIFCFNNITNLKEHQAMVNFYKCGDKLPKPHYLSWNIIISEAPNFHLPDFFGKCTFN
jgi:hypothetical protein